MAGARRVVITAPWGRNTGGAENYLLTFLRHVDRERIAPTVVFLQAGPFPRQVAALHVPTEVIPAGRLRELGRFLATVRSLSSLLRSERPDLVVNWTEKSHVYGAPAAIMAGLGSRVVWFQHGLPDGHWLERLATLLPAQSVGCCSLAASAAQAHLRPTRSTFTVYPGVEPPEHMASERREALRQRVNIPIGRPVVGIVARLERWKGQLHLLRALALMRDAGAPVHGLIVGGDALGRSPDYVEALHRTTRDLGLGGLVTFTGQVPSALPYIELMDVLVNLSVGEPFGIVLIEAMSLGIPVVAVARAGPSEIVVPECSGLLLASSEPEEIARALQRLMADAGLRERLGAEGRRRFTERFTARRMAADLTASLERLCGRPETSSSWSGRRAPGQAAHLQEGKDGAADRW